MKRREFLNYTGKGVLLSSLLGKATNVFGNVSLLDGLDTYETDRVLVIVQLFGGNDGLNTFIPKDQYSNLSQARSNILIPENSILPINGITNAGFHPSMTGFQSMYNEGKLNVVQSVGYDNPNYSHFRSTDIWMSGSDEDQSITTGWAGRYLSNEYPNFPTGYPNTTMPHPLSIQIEGATSLSLIGNTGSVATVIGLDQNNVVSFGQRHNDPLPTGYAGVEMNYIRTVANQAESYSQTINDALGNVPNSADYPDTMLAKEFKVISKLIKGGLKTRVYLVNLGGFDTHASQTNVGNTTQGSHADLLKTVSDAIKAFSDDLAFQGTKDRVIGMVFSEFGRRIKSNSSQGTDHGAAAPLFLFGDPVASGVLGTNVQIPSNAFVDDNIPYQYDFRSVYASILKNWFCVNETDLNSILLRNFQDLPLIASNSSCLVDIHEANAVAGINMLKPYPNPFMSSIQIDYATNGGHTMIQIINMLGQVVGVLLDNQHEKGNYTISANLEHLPAGNYYIRLQNMMIQQVKPIVKM